MKLLGYKMRSEKDGLADEKMDAEMGVKLLNFIADFWDMIEQYKLQNKESSNRNKRETPSR